jgi:hypothetical protein
MDISDCKVGLHVKFSPLVTREIFNASEEEWNNNPRSGTIIEHQYGEPDWIFVEMDKEWSYNEKDMTCWLQGSFEIMQPDQLDPILNVS